MKRTFWFPFLLLLLMFGTSSRVYPQASDDAACTALVQAALPMANTACQQAAPDSICFGYPSASATFSLDSTPSRFTTIGDNAALADVLALTTQAANPTDQTWGIVTASIGDTNPLRYTLLGDATLSSSTSNTPPPPTCEVVNSSGANVNIRSGPSTSAALAGQMGIGASAMAIGRNPAGDWYQIEYLDVMGWVFASLFTGECGTLQVIDPDAAPTPQYLQTISLQTGESAACPAAPNGLLIQAPADAVVEVTINTIPLQLSGVAFISAPTPDTLTLTSLAGTNGGGGVVLLPGFATTLTNGTPSTPAPTQREDLLGLVVETLVYGDQRGAASQSLVTVSCTVGQSMVLEVPFSQPRDYDMTVGISYLNDGDMGVAATYVNLEDFRVTCQAVGTYQLALSVRYGNGTSGEVFLYSFEVTEP